MIGNHLFIGIDIGGTNTKGGLVSRDGTIVAEKTIPTGAFKPAEYTLNQVVSLIHELTRMAEGSGLVTGIGIGAAGQVDFESGIYIEGPNVPNWKNIRVALEIEKIVNKPVILDNDAHLAALGEYTYGAGRGVSNMLMVTIGTGVGGGLILDGRLYRGKKYTAGEFGHTTIRYDGPVCACGRKGCVEAFIGKQAILKRVQEKLVLDRTSLLHRIPADEMEPRHVGEAAAQGDEIARNILRETGEFLGIGLANVANLLNIEKAVIGGGVSYAGEWIFQSARERLAKEALKVPRETIQVVHAALGNKAGLTGAAHLAMDFFDHLD